jgi:hypothetical protein
VRILTLSSLPTIGIKHFTAKRQQVQLPGTSGRNAFNTAPFEDVACFALTKQLNLSGLCAFNEVVNCRWLNERILRSLAGTALVRVRRCLGLSLVRCRDAHFGAPVCQFLALIPYN